MISQIANRNEKRKIRCLEVHQITRILQTSSDMDKICIVLMYSFLLLHILTEEVRSEAWIRDRLLRRLYELERNRKIMTHHAPLVTHEEPKELLDEGEQDQK
uniref:Uncharacterized protein n=1 Tax=Romanomermis culicivorax TaxID=13658 RepID=A0A915JRV3_ROMCU